MGLTLYFCIPLCALPLRFVDEGIKQAKIQQMNYYMQMIKVFANSEIELNGIL